MFEIFTQDMDIKEADNCSACGMISYGKLIENKFICTTCLNKNPNKSIRDPLFDDDFKEAYKEKMSESTIYTGEDPS